MVEKVKVNEYYGNDFSRSYEAVIIDGKLVETTEDKNLAHELRRKLGETK
jgi:hypothetical protein